MIGKNIKRLRLGAGYSQEQLARKLKISQGAVSQWEKEKTVPDTNMLLEMASLFNVSLDEFADDSPRRELDGVVAMRRLAVPIVGSIACSPQREPEVIPDGYADLPEGVRADFALKCKGDSMSPMFNDGDLVLIRQQPEVESGQVAAVGINGETTLKHVYKTDNGLLLFANNPKYEPIQTKPEDDVLIFGLAVGYVRMF